MEKTKEKKDWKNKLKHEFIEYWINASYMAIFFSVFIFYRRMILSHYDIFLEDYFFGAIKALVFAKVIMIGAFFGFDRYFEHKPLIISVFYKAFIFSIWVAVFDIAEKFVTGFIHTSSLSGAIEELSQGITSVWIGGAVVVLFSFIPFFAFKELSRIMGNEKIQDLFFRKRVEK